MAAERLTASEYVDMAANPEGPVLPEQMSEFELGYVLSASSEPEILKLALLQEAAPTSFDDLYASYTDAAGLNKDTYFKSTLRDDIARMPAGFITEWQDNSGDSHFTRTPMATALVGFGGNVINDVVLPHNISLRDIFGLRRSVPASKDGINELTATQGPLRTLLLVHRFLGKGNVTLPQLNGLLRDAELSIGSDSGTKKVLTWWEEKGLVERRGTTRQKNAVLWNTTSTGKEVFSALETNVASLITRSPERTAEGLDKMDTLLAGEQSRFIPFLIRRASASRVRTGKPTKVELRNNQIRAIIGEQPDLLERPLTTKEIGRLLGERITGAQLKRIEAKLGGLASLIFLGKQGTEAYWQLKPGFTRPSE